MTPDTGWFKSSYSNSGSDACIEVRFTDATAGVRDSKDRQGGALWLSSYSWSGFLSFAKSRAVPVQRA